MISDFTSRIERNGIIPVEGYGINILSLNVEQRFVLNITGSAPSVHYYSDTDLVTCDNVILTSDYV